ncbi:MAG: hypothetical protein H7Y22_09055 [Gemmatimonadaceae bacterium]|nr:hypothetical protein [Gloeobacterales cyanobacterium ES-bin-141]
MKKYLLVFLLGAMLVGCGGPAAETGTTDEAPGGAMSTPEGAMESTP